jgi:drug/metabolite transporter (DMT)-like permease
MMRRRELGLFVGVVLLWGVNWPMMKMALAELDFWVFRTWCIAAGFTWFLAYNLKTNTSLMIPREYWARMFVCAMCNVAGWNILSASGLSLLPSGRAGLLAYTMPLWVVLLSRPFLGEALTLRRIAAIALGMSGVALLLIDEFTALKAAPVGALLMVASGFVWAFGIVLTKRFPKTIPTSTMMIWSFALGGWPILLGALLTSHSAWLPTAPSAWAGLLFNVIVVFGFCWFAWNELVRALPAQVTGISSLLVPIVGFISGMLLLGEAPRTFDYVALLAIVGAVAMVLMPKRERTA